jgi:UDP-glucose 4-epimerase
MQSDKNICLYNITSAKGVTLQEQVEVIINLFKSNKRSKIIYNPKIANNTPSYLFSIEKAGEILVLSLLILISGL